MNTLRSINDHFRTTCAAINVTASIHALGPEFFRRALNIVRHYDNFRPDVNPYDDHDCGTFKLDGYECAWAIDYYNRDMSGASADPTNTNITTRLLTIMLASEMYSTPQTRADFDPCSNYPWALEREGSRHAAGAHLVACGNVNSPPIFLYLIELVRR